MSDPLEFARRELEMVDAESAITADLRGRIAEVGHEVETLIVQAMGFRRRVEDLWTNQVSPLSKEHHQRLKVLFPEGIPDDCWTEFERMSGFDGAVDDPFHLLLQIVHNMVPDYPYETRDLSYG
ncbi:MAG: hypothetical protein ACRD2C_02075 [Acidimicrobiales bacterium]